MPTFLCSTCSARIKAPDQLIGKISKCPRCKAPVFVRSDVPVETPAPAAPPPLPVPQALVPLSPVIVPAVPPPSQVQVQQLQTQVACPYCGEAIMAVARKCKHCGEMLDPNLRAVAGANRAAEYQRFEQPKQQINIYAPPARGSNSLGIASLVVGCAAFVVSIIPCLGMLSLPVAGLGLLLGVLALVISLCSGGRGIGFAIAGTGISGIALLIGFFWFHAADSAKKALEEKRPDAGRVTPPPADEPPERFTRRDPVAPPPPAVAPRPPVLPEHLVPPEPDVRPEPAMPARQEPTPAPPRPPIEPEEKQRAVPVPDVQDNIQALALAKKVKSPNAADRIKAIEALGAMGYKAKAGRRALVDALFDSVPQVVLAANQALNKVDPELLVLVALLVECPNDPMQVLARLKILVQIRGLGSDGAPAVPALIRYMQLAALSGVSDAEVLAVRMIGELAADEPEVTKLFVVLLLGDPEPGVRAESAHALAAMNNGAAAVGALSKALQTDQVEEVRLEAARTLGLFGAKARAAAPALAAAKADPSAAVREAAVMALEAIRK